MDKVAFPYRSSSHLIILRRLGDEAVVADEELVSRRGVVVEQALGRLRHQRLLAEHDQLVALARELQILQA